MDNNLKLKKIDRDLIDIEVALMLMSYGKELIKHMTAKGKTPDENAHARRIVAYLREHMV